MTDDVGTPDEGLAAERTSLAWQRTCLAFAVSGLLATRYISEQIGGIPAATGFAGTALAIASGLMATAGRSRRTTLADRRADSHANDAWPQFLAVACALLLGLTCTIFVIGSP
ncbi:DUF202 domain-containing protein [Gordonia malaquae]|uniref:DUF202 domain-containing protein n=1 Tax=Gordonia malaquae TaxID=410332 RepID=UPI003BF80782